MIFGQKIFSEKVLFEKQKFKTCPFGLIFLDLVIRFLKAHFSFNEYFWN